MPSGKQNLADLREILGEFIRKAPYPMDKQVAQMLGELKEIVLEARQPRLILFGRRGAGKSSFINALLGEERAPVGDVRPQTGRCRWESIESERGELRILDTRGIGESLRPSEESDAENPQDEILQTVRAEQPDAVLFLCKASEVGARLDEDTAALDTLRQAVQKQYQYDIPVIGLVTKIDELAPGAGSVNLDHPRKKANVDDAAEILQGKLPTGSPVYPICTYLEFEEGQISYDRRWGLEPVMEYLLDVLPNSALLQMARAAQFKAAQKKVAIKLVTLAAGLAGAIGITPIPLADMPLITGIQIAMITGVAYIAGRRLDKQAAGEFMAALGVNAGLAWGAREAARFLVRVVFPGAGSAVSGAVASAGTMALGRAAVAYFIDRQPIETVRKQLKRAQSETDRTPE